MSVNQLDGEIDESIIDTLAIRIAPLDDSLLLRDANAKTLLTYFGLVSTADLIVSNFKCNFLLHKLRSFI